MSQEQSQFSSKLGVLLATLSSAVGLGNIWKFPAMAGSEGGASFVFLYIIACLLLGLPLMIVEIALGRHGRSNVFGAIKTCTKNPFWLLIPIFSLLASILVVAYYTDIAGWVLAYFGYAISNNMHITTPEEARSFFNLVSQTPSIAYVAQCIFVAMLAIVLMLGITVGIERLIKMILPLLLILLTAIALYNLFLPGVKEGLLFLFYPDFSKITLSTFLAATGLAFFKLAVGLGSLFTYGAYFPKNQNIPLVATRVMFGDLFISLLAGIAIFPAVFTYNFPVQEGASLLFLTIPTMFARMPYGSLLTALFFALTLFATVGASLALLEVSVSVYTKRLKRPVAVFFSAVIVLVLGFFATTSLAQGSSFIIAGKSVFDFFDILSSSYLMPLSALLTAILAGWFLPKNILSQELTNDGTQSFRFLQLWFFVLKFIAPLLLLTMFITDIFF